MITYLFLYFILHVPLIYNQSDKLINKARFDIILNRKFIGNLSRLSGIS